MEKPKSHFLVLTELEKAISEGNIEDLKKSGNIIIDYTSNVGNQAILRNYYDDTDNPIRSTNLVILACRHNQVKILEYLFGTESKIVNNLSVDIGRPVILPDDTDETQHNAFYYAIRSSNTELLNILIDKWPVNYFDNHVNELDLILSKAYEELKLKNVLLSDEMEVFVENKLINLRFYSNASESKHGFKSDLNNIRERIELILENISLLKTNYSNTEEVDKRFLFVAKFIAQNIHTLKRQLKSTYIRLPWEEMEFCLISFISSHTKQQETNLFYRAILDKSKLINHLENFSKKLEGEKDIIKDMNIGQLSNLPKLKRDKVVAEIISSYPPFEELYNDYRQIRDIYSLDKINVYIKLALSADPKERDGQLIITRALQVIGEYLKNTLESPNISNTTSELFLLSLPKNARDIIIDFRNSLSHACSLSKRIEIEENSQVNVFVNVQNDTETVGDVISYILFINKIKSIRILLEKIIISENLNDIMEIAEILDTVELDQIVTGNFKMLEHKKLKKLLKELSNNITDSTNYEKDMLNDLINSIINGGETQSENIQTDYITGLASLKSLCIGLKDNKTDRNAIRGMKFRANHTLQIMSSKIKPDDLKSIAQLAMKISRSVGLRMQQDQLDKVNRLICEIFYIVEFATGDVKWIEELREKFTENGSFIPTRKQKQTCGVTAEKYNTLLAVKLSDLKSVLNKNSLSGQLVTKLSNYKSDKKLQAVVEMLVLDIMSILSSSKHSLENNLLFLDDNTPLLTGKCLRNHLAHHNALIDILLSDPLMAVILNAKKLSEENLTKTKKKLGNLVSEDPFKLRVKYNEALVNITDQEKMFAGLEEGNLDILKCCLKGGTDLYARSINSWTPLHYAAKGPCLEVVKFIVNRYLNVNVKDINGQTPLHIAAIHGRQHIVEFFVTETSLGVDEPNNCGKTPLHLAAQHGHKDTVEVLLNSKANTGILDMRGLSPLSYAIMNNHVDVAGILLEKDVNVDINESMGSFTPLHGAAQSGHLEIVNFLLQNKADVNVKNDRNWMPLHAAVYNGCLEVVNTLILNGADVNARVINDCTPLYYAVENGDENIVNVLLAHGANVNAVEKTHKFTPLHYAAKNGHEEIVKTLLNNKANANVASAAGITPLHFAVQSGILNIVAVLLQHGVQIHDQDNDNATPLHYAAENGHTEVAEFLIKNGANISAKTKNNLTPLHQAALKGYKDVVELLIENKAPVNVQDIKGSTPLHEAAINGSQDIIDLLIKNKAKVNTKTCDGMTPLHKAAINGHAGAVDFLIKHNAHVKTKGNCGHSPLHSAVVKGHKDVVNVLIKNAAIVNETGIEDNTALHIAVEAGYKEIVEILVANGAKVNLKSCDMTPLFFAISSNQKEIVEILIANGADVNVKGNEALSLAVLAGYRDIVEILLKHKVRVNVKGPENITQLHLAARKGHKEIANALISRGADVNAMTNSKETPLSGAAQEGNEEVAEILIENGANVNAKGDYTALHMAAEYGHSNVVKLLLDNKANVNIKDNENRTSLEMAVAYGRLEVVKMLLKYKKNKEKKVDMNSKGNDDWTLLHIASQESNLEIIKYLVDEGSNIHARNGSGAEPIHVAAKAGHKDTVEFFLSKGLHINEIGGGNQTLLHYAVKTDQLEITKYLIAQGIDLNAKDSNGLTALHIAAAFGFKDVTEVLLRHGAVYNHVDKFDRTPIKYVKDKNVIALLASTDKLFEAVKHNNCAEVENSIKAGAFVNAKNIENVTPLHYAAWKGYEEVVKILLRNKANPNVITNKWFTPLHYAARFSHLNVVLALLSNYAIYNAVSDCGKTPSDFTVDKSITCLLTLVDEAFNKIEEDNSTVVDNLNTIKDIDTVKAVMNAHNRENKTLVVAAMHSNFSKVDQLKEVAQDDISKQINVALEYLDQCNYQTALNILKNALEKRKEILGSDNPGTLDIQKLIGHVLYTRGDYQKALNAYEEILQKQEEILGLNDKETLSTRSLVATVLHKLGKDEVAIKIFQEVYQKQKDILEPDNSDFLDTQFHMALALDRLGKHEEALNINRAVFEIRTNMFGENDPSVVRAQNNIAMVLASQGNYEEALKIYKEVLEKKKAVLGVNHSDTLRTLHNIAGVLGNQKKYPEALKAHQELLNIQSNILGPNHLDTSKTRYHMGNVLFSQGKWIAALQAYRESLHHMKTIFGSNHFSVLDILQKIKTLNEIFKIEGNEALEVLQQLQKDINLAANNGDLQAVQRLLQDGADVNDRDMDGRTSLHFAVGNGHLDVVNILLQSGADLTQVTNKGNTPLHTATSKGSKEIVEVLLQHVNRDILNDFINAKTTATGTASLHVAAKNGSLDVTKSLLKKGAIYDIQNNEGKTPLDLCKEKKVRNFLKLVEELFEDAKHGKVKIIDKLRAMQPDDCVTVTNARNNQGKTLLQVVIANKHKNVACQLLAMLKRPN